MKRLLMVLLALVMTMGLFMPLEATIPVKAAPPTAIIDPSDWQVTVKRILKPISPDGLMSTLIFS
jgi:hypothetical protein